MLIRNLVRKPAQPLRYQPPLTPAPLCRKSLQKRLLVLFRVWNKNSPTGSLKAAVWIPAKGLVFKRVSGAHARLKQLGPVRLRHFVPWLSRLGSTKVAGLVVNRCSFDGMQATLLQVDVTRRLAWGSRSRLATRNTRIMLILPKEHSQQTKQ